VSGRSNRSLQERFWAKVEPEPNTGCFLCVGSQDGNGYGHMQAGGRFAGAHRIAWELTHGPIEPGINVLHRCDVRWCVNVGHLFLGTQAENVKDMISKGRDRTPARVCRSKTHCPMGHPYDRIESDGHRRCSECYGAVRRRADARHYQKLRARRAA